MALPIGYSWRNLFVRRASTLFTALGIAITVAVFCGVFALRNGFEQLYRERGSHSLALYLRQGANSEGESVISREQASIIVKERPEISRDESGQPLAAAEAYLAVNLRKLDGGLTNVPLRGVQPMSFRVSEDGPRIVDGRMLQWGADEVIVPERLVSRFRGCSLGDTVLLNLTPFRVVGTFRSEGVYDGEIWGDVERVMEALERPYFQRIIARVDAATIDREAAAAGGEEGTTSIEALSEKLRSDARAPLQIQYEREYLAKQTSAISETLATLAQFLTVIMGIAAVLGAMNTMIAAVAARVHEIGVLKSIGYRPGQIFGAFLLESGIIGLAGGALGLLLVLPFHGVETGLTNWNTFTDVSFSFRLSPGIALSAFAIAFSLGLIGGALPALRAARLQPVDALRIR